MDEAWCLMGDFKTLRFEDYRIGGTEVHDHELRELATFLTPVNFTSLNQPGPISLGLIKPFGVALITSF